MDYFNAFWVGGLICVVGQILIDKTKLTPARILTTFVCAGVFLTLFGLYEPIIKFAGAGARVPISGFGYLLGKGAMEAVDKDGFIGIFTGGITAASAGLSAVMFFGFLFAVMFKSKEK